MTKSRLDQPELMPMRSDYQLLHQSYKHKRQAPPFTRFVIAALGLQAFILAAVTIFELILG